MSIAELILEINIALGNLDVTACEPVDADCDGKCEVNELVLAVNGTLSGCPDDDDGGPAITLTPVEWTIALNTHGAGTHTVFMIADVSPLIEVDLQDLGGKLIWEETQVTLCFIHIRDVGDGFLRIGDGFQSDFQGPGCNVNTTMRNAFDDFGLPQTACLSVRSGDVDYEYCAPLNVIGDDGDGGPAIAFTPVQWTIALDAAGAGIHSVFMIADVSPLIVDDLQDLGGELIWEETQVQLCADPTFPPVQFGKFISIRDVGDGFLRIGDGFQTNTQGSGCNINTTMQNAFDDFGLPQTACLSVRSGDVDYEYCAPLNVIGDNDDGGPAITFTPVQWTIALDAAGAGIHGIGMIADVSPLMVDDLQDLGGELIWEETQVTLCADPTFPPVQWGKFISIRDVGDGFLRIGDGFEPDTQGSGCNINTTMQDAFDDFGLPQTACLSVRSGDVDYEYCAPLNVIGDNDDGGPAIAVTPVQWTIALDAAGAGIHTVFMIADVSPLMVDDLQDLGGELIWEETQVTLCADPTFPPVQFGKFISIRDVGDGFLRIGDGFQSNHQGSGCNVNTTMRNAFDDFGLPTSACLSVRSGDVDYEYCAPLNVIGDNDDGGPIDPPAGMISWWPGDGNADDIVDGNHGTMHGDATFAPGMVGQAFSFDGDADYVQASTLGLPTGNDDRTLEMWVKIDAFRAQEEAFFAGYGSFGSRAQTYHLGTVYGDRRLFFSSWYPATTSPLPLEAGRWYHIAVTNVSNSVTLYLDGTPVSTETLTINTPEGTQFDIGAIPGPPIDICCYRRLKGLIDEVSIYNRALTGGEIKAIYDAGSAGKSKVSVARCPGDFDMTVLEWFWESVGEDDYGIHTLLEVDGPEECYRFEGYHEHTWLELRWNEGVSHAIYRTSDDFEHSGFGPRSCDASSCEIGDIFETGWVYPDYPQQAELQALIDRYGAPDEACGYVSNADLIVKEYCGTFGTVFLADLKPASVEVGFGELSIRTYAFTDRHVDVISSEGDPIILYGVEYAHGVMAHGDSRLAYDLSGAYGQLHATIGIEERFTCGDGAVFVVLADGRDAFRSDLMTASTEPVEFTVNVDGVDRLELMTLQEDAVNAGLREPQPHGTYDLYCDWTIWGDPILIY